MISSNHAREGFYISNFKMFCIGVYLEN